MAGSIFHKRSLAYTILEMETHQDLGMTQRAVEAERWCWVLVLQSNPDVPGSLLWYFTAGGGTGSSVWIERFLTMKRSCGRPSGAVCSPRFRLNLIS